MADLELGRVLHLQVGDPVPSLTEIGGPDLEPLRGRYVLLVTVDGQQAIEVLEGAMAAAAERAIRGLEVIALCHGDVGHEDPRVYDDDDGRCALRLGARTPGGDTAPVAVLIEPRGRVHVSCSGADSLRAVEAALNALKRPATA